MTARWLLLVPSLAALFAGCVDPGAEAPPEIGFRVFHLTESGPQAGLPPDADTLRFIVITEGEEDDPVDFANTVVGLDDLDGDGDPDARISDIPVGRNVSITVHAKLNVRLLATARVDGIRLENGGRRYVNLTFTTVTESSTLPHTLPSGRFAHGAARIAGADGRVLITGGFTASAPMPCPASLASSVACFQLTATNEALLVEPSDGSVRATQNPMLRPRALHTTTPLGDGRILIAGGVTSAVLGLERIEGREGDFEFRPHIVPDAGFERAARTFEIFDPTLLREEHDDGRDGDPLAGDFVGAPGYTLGADGRPAPGQMNVARYMHAAAMLPESDTDVMIVGGQGAAESSVSAEIFYLERAGGAGFAFPPTYVADTSMDRSWPAAATTPTHVYVIGGSYPPTTLSQHLERWSAGEPPTSGGSFTGLEACPGWSPQPRPRNALVGASAIILGSSEQRVLVTGWLGPLCTEPAAGTHASVEDYNGTLACTQSTYSSRSFSVGTSLCDFGGVMASDNAHFLGPAAPLPNGGAVLAGGFTNGAFNVTDAIELYTGQFRADSHQAERDTGFNSRLNQGRAWHTATPLNGGRVLFAGGMYFYMAAGVPSDIALDSSMEIYDPGWDPINGPGAGD